MIKGIRLFLDQTLMLFCINDLMGILICTDLMIFT